MSVAGIPRRKLDLSMRSRAVQLKGLWLTIISFIFFRPVSKVTAIIRERRSYLNKIFLNKIRSSPSILPLSSGSKS